MTTNSLTGHCLCGDATYRVSGGAQFSIRCFCSDCQRATGTGSAVQVGVESSKLTVMGPLKAYERKADSGSELSFRYCGNCGSPLIKTTSKAPNLAFLYAGALDQAEAVGEPKLVFVESRQAWDHD